MTSTSICPECGAPCQNDGTCQDHFYKMLFWENENPILWNVHHLMVLCYHIQHPGLISRVALSEARQLLFDFVRSGISTDEARHRMQGKFNSRDRSWKIKASSGSRGTYEANPQWEIRAVDVIAEGIEKYDPSVRKWANSILDTLISMDDFLKEKF